MQVAILDDRRFLITKMNDYSSWLMIWSTDIDWIICLLSEKLVVSQQPVSTQVKAGKHGKLNGKVSTFWYIRFWFICCCAIRVPCWGLGPLLLTWLNFSPCMD